MAPPEERRRQTRIESINLVSVDRFDEQGVRADLAVGRSLDLTTEGARLELGHPLPLRARVELGLALEDRVVPVTAKVVFVQELDDTRCAIGLQFVDLDDEGRAAIAAHLAGDVSEPAG